MARDSAYTNPEHPWLISNASEFFDISSAFWIIQALVGRGDDGDWET